MMSLWDALRMNMMISYQELVRTFPRHSALSTWLNKRFEACAHNLHNTVFLLQNEEGDWTMLKSASMMHLFRPSDSS